MTHASAQSFDSMQIAMDLGSVLGSEEACGLEFDQSAIAGFIEDKVAADDMSFASNLQTMTMGQEYQLADYSKSALTAHCTQISRVAKSYGFTY
jgi:hypothetical protein